MKNTTHPIDDDVVYLDGGLFAGMPYRVIPLDNFHLGDREPARSEANDDDLKVTLEEAPVASATTAEAPAEAQTPEPATTHGVAEAKEVEPLPATVTMPKTVAALEPDPTPRAIVTPIPVAPKPQKRLTPRRRFKKSGLVAGAAAMMVSGLALAAMMIKSDAPAPRAESAAPAATEATPAASPVAPSDLPEETAMVDDEPEEEASEPAVPVVTATPPAPPPVVYAPKSTTGTVPAIAFRLPEIPTAAPTAERFISRSAAAVSIAAAARGGSYCASPDAPVSIPVAVTFAASGKVTRAIVSGGPFAGTPEGSCLASALRSATVPPFDGAPVTVNTNVTIR